MSNLILDESISFLNISTDIVTRLKSNNIIYIKDLWPLKRCDLKELGFNNKDINEIIIKMQLNGIDLNKKYVK